MRKPSQLTQQKQHIDRVSFVESPDGSLDRSLELKKAGKKPNDTNK